MKIEQCHANILLKIINFDVFQNQHFAFISLMHSISVCNLTIDKMSLMQLEAFTVTHTSFAFVWIFSLFVILRSILSEGNVDFNQIIIRFFSVVANNLNRPPNQRWKSIDLHFCALFFVFKAFDKRLYAVFHDFVCRLWQPEILINVLNHSLNPYKACPQQRTYNFTSCKASILLNNWHCFIPQYIHPS